MPTPSWRVSTILYIYICTVLHSTLYRIQIFTVHSTFYRIQIFTVHSTLYRIQIFAVHSTLYRIQIFKIYSIFKPNPNISNISYFNTGSKYLQYTTGFCNNPCIVGMVQHRVQYRQHIENSTIKIPVHIWYSTYIYCIHTSGLFSTQYIFTGTVHTGCPRASA